MHNLDLLHQAESAPLGGGGEGPGGGDGLPLDCVGHPLVLQLPDVSCQSGSHPLSTVPESVRVVVVSGLPVGLGQPDVGLVHLAHCRHRGLVDGVGVEAPGPLHGAVLRPTSAVAVAVERSLNWEVVVDHLHVVPRYDLAQIGHRPVGQLDGVTVEDTVEGVADREAAVEDGEELVADLGLDRHAERGVEPRNLPPASSPDSACSLLLRFVNQLLLVAGPLERLLVDPLGGVEDLLR